MAANYGDIPLVELQTKPVSGRRWTEIGSLDAGLIDQVVHIRGRLHKTRALGKRAFLMVRNRGRIVQCVVALTPGLVSIEMVGYAASLSKESIINVEGVVVLAPKTVESATQQHVEIHVTKIHCIDKANPVLPISIEDASRSEAEAGESATVGQENQLNHRTLSLRTSANRAIFELKSEVALLFSQFLKSKGFIGIQTPKLISGSSEGGSAVFNLQYMGQPACLAQSPQLHKQMAICSDLSRVYEVGPVYRAENSDTHRHLCEFVSLDVEMEIMEHYSEVMDVVDELFVSMFESINTNFDKQLQDIGRQYPFEPLKYLPKTLRLTFEEGIKMLQEEGIEVDPLGDLNTKNERRLGELVKAKYGTDFFILYGYPLAVRPFYTMPCFFNPEYSNSFDVFIRGEEIISGSQRIHDLGLLEKRAKEKGIDVGTISHYLKAFEYGAPPHGGFAAGLERVVMLFCGLDNVRKTSLFPRDTKRLAP